MTIYVPMTPEGIPMTHLKSDKKTQAMKNLINDAKPYFNSWELLEELGYTIEEYLDA